MQPYPVQLSVDYPDRPLNRLTTAFRILTIIPIALLFGLLANATVNSRYSHGGDRWFYVGVAGGTVVLPVVFMLLFRKKYPRWWFTWNLEFTRFMNRIAAYLFLMDDRYPSTDEEQSVHLVYPEVTGAELSRGLPLVKWLLAIPHYIVLLFLLIAVVFVLIFVWFAILFTGRYPRGAFGFVEGFLRWVNRVSGYAFTLVTDVYPPFTLSG
jgi:Domain of unknown function (DUF4389)